MPTRKDLQTRAMLQVCWARLKRKGNGNEGKDLHMREEVGYRDATHMYVYVLSLYFNDVCLSLYMNKLVIKRDSYVILSTFSFDELLT